MLDNQFSDKNLKGMTVHDSEGKKLGKVAEVYGNTFIVEKGFFFPEERTFQMSDILTIEDNDIRISHHSDTLRTGASSLRDSNISDMDDDSTTRDSSYASRSSSLGTSSLGASGLGASSLSSTGLGTSGLGNSSLSNSNLSSQSLETDSLGMQSRMDLSQERRELSDREDLVIPVIEEEVVVQKTSREAGEIHVRKEVITEMRNVQVPVTREEVIVERVAVNRDADVGATANFMENEIVVPVREDEVVIGTRPVVREEVHIRKEAVADTYNASTQVKKERVEVDSQGGVKRKTGKMPVSTSKSNDLDSPLSR